MAKRMGIPVYHMEAGNRCYSDVLPEETNRRLIDHSSDIHLPYTERSRQNLLREGIASNKIFVAGNPIYEVMGYFSGDIRREEIRSSKRFSGKAPYFLVTCHRAETVDNEKRLQSVILALKALRAKYGYDIIYPIHPHTAKKIVELSIDTTGIGLCEPMPFFMFSSYEKHAACILTDSGTVQEDACILRVHNVILRDVTERPETIECGSGIIAGVEPERILKAVEVAMASKREWNPPSEYLRTDVSDTVIKILTGV
jgi:UDP-N-acetylglucosamine 2-epimerase (non-hydrolysing)